MFLGRVLGLGLLFSAALGAAADPAAAQLPAVLRISVRSADSDLPLSGVLVEAVGSFVTDRTDATGLATLRGVFC